MGVKRGLRSNFAKFSEPSPSKINRLLLGGDENPFTKEQWIIPSIFEDYLFDKILNWDSVSCSKDPPYTVCGEPDDLLTMDLDLKPIPRLDTCRGDFASTIDVVIKFHTSVSRGWRSWCQKVLAHPPSWTFYKGCVLCPQYFFFLVWRSARTVRALYLFCIGGIPLLIPSSQGVNKSLHL